MGLEREIDSECNRMDAFYGLVGLAVLSIVGFTVLKTNNYERSQYTCENKLSEIYVEGRRVEIYTDCEKLTRAYTSGFIGGTIYKDLPVKHVKNLLVHNSNMSEAYEF